MVRILSIAVLLYSCTVPRRRQDRQKEAFNTKVKMMTSFFQGFDGQHRQNCCTALLLYCCIAALLYCCIGLLVYAVSLYCRIAILLFCIALYCYMYGDMVSLICCFVAVWCIAVLLY